MASNVYQTLQNQLDQYSVGYPATQSGIEIKILKKLFSEKEAELFLRLSLLPEASDNSHWVHYENAWWLL
jgi:hypothetical protein